MFRGYANTAGNPEREGWRVERRKVNSGAIRSVGYDPSGQLLEIEFSSGSIVQYSRVGSETHRRLMSAPSMQSYFRDHIEESFSARRVR